MLVLGPQLLAFQVGLGTQSQRRCIEQVGLRSLLNVDESFGNLFDLSRDLDHLLPNLDAIVGCGQLKFRCHETQPCRGYSLSQVALTGHSRIHRQLYLNRRDYRPLVSTLVALRKAKACDMNGLIERGQRGPGRV